MTRVAFTPRGWILKSRLSNGAVVFGENRAGFGGRGIYIYRDLIEPEFCHLARFLDSEGVFVDVGASTGIYSIKAAGHYGTRGVVLAIEPFPDALAVLQHSVQANGFANVRMRNLAVGDRTAVRLLWQNFGKPNSFSLIKRDPNARSMSVVTVTLDDLLKWEDLNRVDYLKIDVEGAEQEVLAGAARTIERYRPIIQVEASIVAPSLSQLPDYAVFHAPESRNRVCIPFGHPKIAVPEELGWTQLVN